MLSQVQLLPSVFRTYIVPLDTSSLHTQTTEDHSGNPSCGLRLIHPHPQYFDARANSVHLFALHENFHPEERQKEIPASLSHRENES